MTGRSDGRSLVFDWRDFDKATGESLSGEFGLELSGDDLLVRTRQSRPGQGDLVRLKLRRR